jgi:hypothetical protein
VTDENGEAHLSIPVSFVAQPGEYVIFAALDDAAPTAVLTYQASAEQVEQN